MKDEISAASDFLTRLIGRQNSDHLSDQQLKQFRNQLEVVLHRKFANHWFPDKPSRGQAFRCIRVNENIRRDSILETVCQEIGLPFAHLIMPAELTLWIDPEEVTCRFGEHKGSYCIVAQFKDGNNENYADTINVDELEQISAERSKQVSLIVFVLSLCPLTTDSSLISLMSQASFDMLEARQRKQARIMAAKSQQQQQQQQMQQMTHPYDYSSDMMHPVYGMQTHHSSPAAAAVMTSANYYNHHHQQHHSPYAGYHNTAGNKYNTSSYSPVSGIMTANGAAAAAGPQSSSPYTQSFSISPTNMRPVNTNGFRAAAGYSSPSFASASAAAAAASVIGSGKFGSAARGLGSAFNSASSASAGGAGSASGASGTSTAGPQNDRFHFVKSSLKA
jgi:hypothetical protein